MTQNQTKTEVPRALVLSTLNGQEDMTTAIDWIVAQYQGKPILSVRPKKNNLEWHYPALAKFLKYREVIDCSVRTASEFHRGPVLLLWPDSGTISTFNQSEDTTALCVLEGSRSATTAWARAFHPDVLNGELETSPIELEPIVEVALQSIGLSANHNNYFIDTSDRDIAINGIRNLLKRGHVLNPSDIYAWTLAHDWPEDSAVEFQKILKKLISGTNMRVSERWDTYSYWQGIVNGELD